jgi:transposase
MPRTHPPYAPEYRRRIVELARAGRSTNWRASSNHGQRDPQWFKQAALDEGRRSDGLTTA